MKNLTVILIFLCFFINSESYVAYALESPVPGTASPAFSGGSGTRNDPYRISTPAELYEIRNHPGAHFIQMADLNLGVAPWNEGQGWLPVCRQAGTPFTGSFNGNGFRIRNLTIRMADSLYVGLFGQLAGAGISNVILENVNVAGGSFTGALAGMVSGGTCSGLTVSGSVTGNGEYTGGIFGMVSGTTVLNSRSEAAVTGRSLVGGLAGSGMTDGCSATGKITGVAAGGIESFAVGGLLGEGVALNSHASGDVSGGSQVGGLIGTGSARGCYATGNVTATGDYAGGLIGDLTPFGDDQNTEQEYTPGMTTPADTAKKTKSVVTISGQPVKIFLDDSTRVLVPAFPTPLTITLEKKGFDFIAESLFPPGSEFRPTGSLRTLTIKGTGDPLAVKPVITIPSTEAGTVNIETINAVRVGSLYVNGELVENHPVLIPVNLDKNGNFVFVDAVFPDGVTPDKLKSATAGSPGPQVLTGGRQITETAWVGNVQYFLMTIDKSLNWSKRPVLERMVPDSTLSNDGYRKPWRRVSPADREKVTKQPICNVVILVHGHNEEEADGYLNSRIVSPWEFNYKRLLWDLLYENISKNREKQFPAGCTAMYEFIAPTYRPIFSPVGSKSGFTHQTLGEDLGNMINEEFESNAQIKAMMDDNVPFNLFVVAHSQGGLVSRAGLRFVKPDILKRLKLVVTWGSPHSGAALYSLRYALSVGHDLVIDGIRLPMQNIGQSEAYQSGVSGIALDAPGIRDLRWDASKADMLRFGELFRENPATLNEIKDTELPNGKMFFSDNLRIFNETEGSFSGDLLKDRYKFYEGTTTKDALMQNAWDIWSLRKFYYFAKTASGIEKGARLNKLAVKPAWSASDGAVPTYSQRGEGIWPAGNIQSRNMGDTDHEEYYGGEDPNRTYFPLSRGKETAWQTLSDMEMGGESRSCPKLDLDIKEAGDTLVITGTLVYPQLKRANGGDDMPGKRITGMGAQRDNEKGAAIPALLFKWKDDGTFEGKGKKAEIPDDTLFVFATLKDQSVVTGVLEPNIENKVFNFSKKLWYVTIQKAVDEAGTKDTILVYPGTYQEYVNIVQKNLTLRSTNGPVSTVLKGEGIGGSAIRAINSGVVIEGFTMREYDYGIFLWNANSDATAYPFVISGNHIVSNERKGIYFTGVFTGVVRNNFIDNNYYNGIDFDKYTLIKGPEPVRIENNIISGTNDRGVRIDGEAWVSLSGNTIRNHEWGVEILGKSTVTIDGDTIEYNTDEGVRIFLAQNPVTITNSVIRNNTYSGIASTTDYGRHTVSNNTITGNGTGIFFEHYSTGSCQVDIINNRVTGNKKGMEVRVAGCTITGNTVSDNTEEGGMVIYSPGEISGNTITGNSSWLGGGIYLQTSGSMVIKKNTITGNQASMYGGGIGTQSEGTIVIQENTISKNQASENGGGIYVNTARQIYPRIEGNTISENYAAKKGGGIYGIGLGWGITEVVTVSGNPLTVPRYVPCFKETTNSWSGNTHGEKFGAWGPGIDKWCDDAGYDVYP